MQITFSIIIPVYNIKEYLGQAVNSIWSQSYPHYEIILIDDGSEDGGQELCDQLAAQDEKIRVLHKANEGLSAARNDGIRVAKGSYIVFLDGDDMLHKDALIEINALLQSYPNVDVVFGSSYLLVNGYVEENGRQPTHQQEYLETESASIYYFLFCQASQAVWNAWRYIVRRAFLVSNNLYFKIGVLCEDVEWTPRLIGKIRSLCILSRPHYYYRYMRPGSIMHSYNSKRTIDLLDNICSSLELCSRSERKDIAYLQDALIREYVAQFVNITFQDKGGSKELRAVLSQYWHIFSYANSFQLKWVRLCYQLLGAYPVALIIRFARYLYRRRHRRFQ